MNKTILLAALAAACAAAPAFAASEASIGYSQVSITPGHARHATTSSHYVGPRYDLGALTGRFAWTQGIFGVEGEASVGVQDGVDGKAASRVSTSLSSELAGYGVVRYDLSPQFTVNARAGYATFNAKTDMGTGAAATHSSASDGGLAYGAGAQWNIENLGGVRFDVTHTDADLNESTATPHHAYKPMLWTLSLVRPLGK